MGSTLKLPRSPALGPPGKHEDEVPCGSALTASPMRPCREGKVGAPEDSAPAVDFWDSGRALAMD